MNIGETHIHLNNDFKKEIDIEKKEIELEQEESYPLGRKKSEADVLTASACLTSI